MKPLVPLFAILALLIFSSCNLAPYSFPDNGVRPNFQAIDSTRITVKKEFRYLPTLTSYVLPTGDYVPIRSDAGGTYYGSPRGVLVLPATGSFVVEGGIYRRSNPKANYPFAIYIKMPGLGWTLVDLHSMWGLNLNEKIECVPAYEFK
jgi:hypothetical protein